MLFAFSLKQHRHSKIRSYSGEIPDMFGEPHLGPNAIVF